MRRPFWDLSRRRITRIMRRMLQELISSKIYRELKYFDSFLKFNMFRRRHMREMMMRGLVVMKLMMMLLMLIKYASSILFHFFFFNRKFP